MALRKKVLKFTTNPAGEPVNRFTENCWGSAFRVQRLKAEPSVVGGMRLEVRG
jgi:hypothetical protein